jgi:hypothetical protein
VASLALRFEARDERTELAAAEHTRERALFEHRCQERVAHQRTKVEQLCGHGQVVHGIGHRVSDADHLMSDAHARVPQRIEHAFHERLERVSRARGHETDVEIALQAEHTSSVTADGPEQHG